MKTEYKGNYGEMYIGVPPIPENLPTIVDKWGWEWLYLGDTDEELVRVAKADENDLVDIAALGHIRMDYFPELDTNN